MSILSLYRPSSPLLETIVHRVRDVLEQGCHGLLRGLVIARKFQVLHPWWLGDEACLDQSIDCAVSALSDDVKFLVLWVEIDCIGYGFLCQCSEKRIFEELYVPKICSRRHLTVLKVVNPCGGI